MKAGSATDAGSVASAGTITRASKSNLALAFVALGREKRNDITVFYAFCRLIDDMADAPDVDVATKAQGLERWRQAVLGPVPGEHSLASEVRTMMTKYSIAPELMQEIVAGVEMDLTTGEYETFEQLRQYCYRVASAVGLVSIEIFGYRNPACKTYAIELGMALQMTNIIRDVGKDSSVGRVYLPNEDLGRFRYPVSTLRNRIYNENFLSLMEFEAGRAREFFQRADSVLPAEDRKSMKPARIMASVYRALLDRIERDRFRVFEKNYRLSKVAKAAHVLAHLVR